MLPVTVLAQSDLDPAVSQALDRELLAAVGIEPRRAYLRVSRLAGDVLSLGRYHLAPARSTAGRVRLHRRLGGGRIVPLGPGFVALALALPHRSALVGNVALALRPEQALGRYVRALLDALRALGVDAFYPGRDRLTVNGRVLGLVSLETDAHGAAAFEAVLAMENDWPCLGALVSDVDPAGEMAAEIVPADQLTCLAAHGVRATVDELGGAIADALHRQFGLEPVAGAVPRTPDDAAAQAEAWIGSRRRHAALDRHAVEWGQLGVFEVYLAARAGCIDDIVLAGDFIADSPSIARLEARLRGCPLERGAIAAVVEAVYAEPQSFLLGLRSLAIVADTIARAA